MVLIILIIFFILYFIIGLKVKQWEDLTTLGWKIQTPEGYLRNPKGYHLTKTFCFIINIILVILLPYKYSATIGLPVLGLLWLVISIMGTNNAFRVYRKDLKEMLENPRDEEQYKSIKNQLSKSNSQIWQEARTIHPL